MEELYEAENILCIGPVYVLTCFNIKSCHKTSVAASLKEAAPNIMLPGD